MNASITLPDGTELDGSSPVVVIGPNGSGKSRKVRELRASVPIDFINALRNTRVAPQIPVMGMDDARNNYNSQKNQARSAYWELSSEFDYMLSQLLAQDALAAKEFVRAYRANPDNPGSPTDTPLSRIEILWTELFPGRELLWKDWKPLISSTTTGTTSEYSGNLMSDGEKAVLFLAGRVFSAETGVLVVDEPETHLHSMLAVNLWNLLEAARPDIRFVYVTHDLTFALSRNNPRYVIASPVGGLKAVEIKTDLPKDVAEALLGSASLSFYASRIVFTEGEQGGLDDMLYSAWFNGRDTVVRPVGGCQTVLRCCEALTTSGISQGLEAVGIIDRDFGSAEFHASLPEYVHPLNVHEVESLFCLYDVVKAVAEHLGKTLCTASEYRALLASEISVAQRHSIILARWKARIEPKLMGVVAGVGKRGQDVDSLATQMPDLFDHNKWSFSPQELLAEEKAAVESILPDGAIGEILSIAPGKPLIALAARTVGQRVKEFTELVTKSLAVSYKGVHDPLSPLGKKIESALEEWLPTRRLHGSPLDN